MGEVVVDPKLLHPLSLQSSGDLLELVRTCLIHSLVTCKSGGAGSGSGAGGLYLTCFPKYKDITKLTLNCQCCIPD